METGGYALGTFIDIDGAFSITLYQVISREAEKHGVPSMIVGLMRRLLCLRNLVANHKDVRVMGSVLQNFHRGHALPSNVPGTRQAKLQPNKAGFNTQV